MTKKDYEAIARVIRETRHEFRHTGEGDGGAFDALGEVSEYLARVMEEDNPRFDRSRFLAACRGEDSKDSAGRTVSYGR